MKVTIEIVLDVYGSLCTRELSILELLLHCECVFGILFKISV